MKEHTSISIQTSTIVKIVAIGLALWLAYIIFDILVLLFIGLILASLIDPCADWFEKKSLPRGIAVVMVYVALCALVSTIGFIIIPAFVSEMSQFTGNFGSMLSAAGSRIEAAKLFAAQYGSFIQIQKLVDSVQSAGISLIQAVINSAEHVFESIVSLIFVLVITFYLVVEDRDVKKAARTLAPSEYQPYLKELTGRVKRKLGYWLRGQLALDVIVGALVYIGLTILRAPYALLIALLAGIMETIPYFGPVMTGITAGVMVFLQTGDGVKTALVVALLVVIQQVESNILVPKVLQKAVGLNPIVSIMSLLIGFRLAGIIGGMLAIPAATALSVCVSDVMAWRSRNEESA